MGLPGLPGLFGLFGLFGPFGETQVPKKPKKPKKPETPQKKRKRSEVADPWRSAETRKGVQQKWDKDRYLNIGKTYRFSPSWFEKYAPKTPLLGPKPSQPSPIR